MEQLEWAKFKKSYINEMIQAEIELEKQVFYDNLPAYVKLQQQLLNELSENLAKEIDDDIIKRISNITDLRIQALQAGENTVRVGVVTRPIFETAFINLNLTITSSGVIFDDT